MHKTTLKIYLVLCNYYTHLLAYSTYLCEVLFAPEQLLEYIRVRGGGHQDNRQLLIAAAAAVAIDTVAVPR